MHYFLLYSFNCFLVPFFSHCKQRCQQHHLADSINHATHVITSHDSKKSNLWPNYLWGAIPP